MKRALSIAFPMLPVQALQRRDRRSSAASSASRERDQEAIFLIAKQAQREVVACCCQRAVQYGVRPFMPVAQARALMPGVSIRIERFDLLMNTRTLRALAMVAQRFSPIVSVDEPDGLLIDVTGCQRVFHGEQRLLKKIVADFNRLGFTLRAAIAPTLACAWAIARFGQLPTTIVAPGRQREAMRDLPVAALRVQADVVTGLEEVGIENVGQLLEIPRSVLPARFGEELLLRLDQAMGQAIEMIIPIRPAAPLRVERKFDGPTTQFEAIHATIIDLLDELGRQLLKRESGAARLAIELERSDLPPTRTAITLSRPSRDRRHLWSLVCPKIENANLGFGVEAISITATHVQRLVHEQIEHWHDASMARCDAAVARHVGELTDTLVSRLGDDRVCRADLVRSHIPEQAFNRSATSHVEKEKNHYEPRPDTQADRPTFLFDRPVPAQVTLLVPDGPMHTIRWENSCEEIIATIGPERIGAPWWQRTGNTSPEAMRDYFHVQDANGRWLWVYREIVSHQAPARWFVHGLWA